MTQYWRFAAEQVVEHMQLEAALAKTTTFAEALKIEMHSEWIEPRPRRKPLPLQSLAESARGNSTPSRSQNRT
jgi:hypothetical protein